MPLYEFQCPDCDHIDLELVPLGTTASSCTFCGEMSYLIMSVPAKAKIRHEATPQGKVLAPPYQQPSAVLPNEDDMSVRVYDFEFGQQEKENLNRLVEKERQQSIFDSYSVG